MEKTEQQKREQLFDRIKFFSLGALALIIFATIVKTEKK